MFILSCKVLYFIYMRKKIKNKIKVLNVNRLTTTYLSRKINKSCDLSNLFTSVPKRVIVCPTGIGMNVNREHHWNRFGSGVGAVLQKCTATTVSDFDPVPNRPHCETGWRFSGFGRTQQQSDLPWAAHLHRNRWTRLTSKWKAVTESGNVSRNRCRNAWRTSPEIDKTGNRRGEHTRWRIATTKMVTSKEISPQHLLELAIYFVAIVMVGVWLAIIC